MKIITLEFGRFEISHPMPSQSIDDYKLGNFPPIGIDFVPSVEMPPAKAISYANEHFEILVTAVKEVMAENPEFFKNVEIMFDRNFSGTASIKNSRHPNRQLTLRAWLHPSVEWMEDNVL